MTFEVGPGAAQGLTLERRELDRIGDRVGMTLAARLLRETLPPDRVTHRVSREHVEAVGQGGWTRDFRWARPVDFWTERYRGRWWGKLLGLHRRTVLYVEVPVPFVNNASVSCDHAVVVEVRSAWTYPNPTVPAPEDQGYGVLHYDHTSVTDSPVFGRSDPWA